MPTHRRYKAPAENGAVLADPPIEQWPTQVEANRRFLDHADGTIGGQPLRELRAMARRELLAAAREYSGHPETLGPETSPEAPIVLAGHQPELSHPGVWVKHFALNGLARRVGGVPLNLVVDNDTFKSATLRFPVIADNPTAVHTEAISFDTFETELPYEGREVHAPELFGSFADRTASVWKPWGYEPLLPRVWREVTSLTTLPIGERFAVARRRWERMWSCTNLELPVSRLARLETFARFAAHLSADLPRFRTTYNTALHDYRAIHGLRSKNHPAPDLPPGEAPFWVPRPGGRRERATAGSDPRNLRPRALTLTLFARLILGDYFIHGIGGGMYDEVTDRLLRDYFGVEPPRYAVLSATLHLPLPHFPHTVADARAVAQRSRDLYWNPQRYVGNAPGTEQLRYEKAARIAAEPARTDRTARQHWFRDLQAVTERMRPHVADQLAHAGRHLTQARAEADANAILTRRDYAWVLYPEHTLRPFLTRFL